MEVISTFPWQVREERVWQNVWYTLLFIMVVLILSILVPLHYTIIIIIIFYRSQLFFSLDYFEWYRSFVHNLKLMAKSKSLDNLSCRDYRHMHHYIRINKKFHNMDLFTNMGIRIKRSCLWHSHSETIWWTSRNNRYLLHSRSPPWVVRKFACRQWTIGALM